MKKRGKDRNVLAVQDWFTKSVTYDGEPYTIDYEQAAAIADTSTLSDKITNQYNSPRHQ